MMHAIAPKLSSKSQIRLSPNRTNRISRRNVPFAKAVLVEYESDLKLEREEDQVADII